MMKRNVLLATTLVAILASLTPALADKAASSGGDNKVVEGAKAIGKGVMWGPKTVAKGVTKGLKSVGAGAKKMVGKGG
ncbi:MAG: hypothetical protein HY711_02700 [Candidatus Melainabacteria bacterium]|nr:hypothetical protein [Candidatus Melainabacteria bacterium]